MDEAAREEHDDEAMRDKYREKYFAWRDVVDEYEREKKELEEKRRAATPPAPVPEPVPTPTPAPESGRRNRAFNTQLDLDQAIALSKAEAEEKEKEQREREVAERQAQMLRDETKEARVPEMLTRTEQVINMFHDTNNLVETRLVLDTFDFLPPVDDFNGEEQDAFIQGYLNTPKKWGHIALGIPGRDYQDCIRHYYLTKHEAKYKTLFNRKANKRGRRAGVRVGRPRANNLMSDLGGGRGYDGSTVGELEMVPVTDTGRPRRAAAPNFAEKEKKDAEAASAKATPARGRGANKEAKAASSGETPEGAPDKPARRGRQAQPGQRAKRGAKTAAPGISPSKQEAEAAAKMKDEKMTDAFVVKDVDMARTSIGKPPDLALGGGKKAAKGLSHGEVLQMVAEHQKHTKKEQELKEPFQQQALQMPASALPTPQSVAINDGHHRSNALTALPLPTPSATSAKPEGSSRSAGTTSYWSVQEHKDFLAYLGHFGSNWQKISGALGTKTQIMVCL